MVQRRCPRLRHQVRRRRLRPRTQSRQLQRRNIINEVRQILRRTGFSADRLTLEVTESSVIREGEDVAGVGAALGDSPGDAASEHAGLARPGSSKNAQRGGVGGDRQALGLVQTPQERVCAHMFER